MILLPDDVDQLPDLDVVRDEVLGLVQKWELLLTLEPLNDDRDLGRVVQPDRLHILATDICFGEKINLA